MDCLKTDAESFYNFGLQFKVQSDKPPKILAREIASRKLADTLKAKSSTAAKTVSVKVTIATFKELEQVYGNAVTYQVGMVLHSLFFYF